LGPLGLLTYLAIRSAQSATRSGLTSRLRAWMAARPEGTHAMVILVVGAAIVLVASLLLQLWDARTLFGVSVWAKPAKFAASSALTVGTIAWFLPALQPLTRGLRRSIALVVWMFGLELALMTMQSARGVASHFNNTTMFDAAVFGVMGIAVFIAWLALVHITWVAFRTRLANPARGWGIRFGMVALVLGSALGGLMPGPTPAQREMLVAGQRPTMIGAHTVGAPDGGPALPMVGWSRTGGDLRIPHFVGIHGLQLLPFVAWGLGRHWSKRRQSPRTAARLAMVAGLGYLGLILVTLVQALRAQPLLAPDLWTWLSLGTLLVGAAVSVAVTLALGGSMPRHEVRWPRLPSMPV
ncbi:MAG TPA: hypothetical protein VGF45_12085, partial [Polyangia bacterium]